MHHPVSHHLTLLLLFLPLVSRISNTFPNTSPQHRFSGNSTFMACTTNSNLVKCNVSKDFPEKYNEYVRLWIVSGKAGSSFFPSLVKLSRREQSEQKRFAWYFFYAHSCFFTRLHEAPLIPAKHCTILTGMLKTFIVHVSKSHQEFKSSSPHSFRHENCSSTDFFSFLLIPN